MSTRYFIPHPEPVEPKRYQRYWPVYLLLLVGLLYVLECVESNEGPGSHVAPKAKCASNLHQIGLAISLYAQDFQGRYPDSLETLLLDVNMAPQVFVCPSAFDTPAIGSTTQQVIDDLHRPGHMSYIYLGKGLTSATVADNDVIAYEPLSNHDGDGMNMLFGDGHAEWFSAAEATARISVATSRATTRFIKPTH